MKCKNIHTQEVFTVDRTEVVSGRTVTVLKDSRGLERRCDDATMRHYQAVKS